MGASPQKTAIVTGSTRGIGLAIALRLLRESYNVVINYARDDQQAQRALTRCQQEGGVSPLLVKADISQKHEVDHLMRESMRAFQRIDVLINNAACVVDRPILELTEEDWDRVIETNLNTLLVVSTDTIPLEIHLARFPNHMGREAKVTFRLRGDLPRRTPGKEGEFGAQVRLHEQGETAACLALCHEILHEHGGRIWSEQEGSISLALPLAVESEDRLSIPPRCG